MCDKAAPAMHVPIEGLFSDAPEKSFAQGLREQAAVLLRGRLLLQPDASRASVRSVYSRPRVIFPSRTVQRTA